MLVRRVKLISWLSLVWMTAEAGFGAIAGILANSVALLGYGRQHDHRGRECDHHLALQLSGHRVHSVDAERRAQKIVAVTFFLLAPYILVAAILHLLAGTHAAASWVGISLAIVSVCLMPLFGRAMKRLGKTLGSSATAGEGTQNILCAYLSLAILIGLGANALAGWWWTDPALDLIVAIVALQTGVRTWRGQAC